MRLYKQWTSRTKNPYFDKKRDGFAKIAAEAARLTPNQMEQEVYGPSRVRGHLDHLLALYCSQILSQETLLQEMSLRDVPTTWEVRLADDGTAQSVTAIDTGNRG